MSDVIGYDLDFYPQQPAGDGEPWEVVLCERFETGEVRPVASGYGFDDFAALRDLIERLAEDGHPNRTITVVQESYAARLRDQMQWPPPRMPGSLTPSERRPRRISEPEHRVTFVTVALKERLVVLPCACGPDHSPPVLDNRLHGTADASPMTVA
jgi:hypothetical protein